MGDPWFESPARPGTVTVTFRTDVAANLGRQTALPTAGESDSASAIGLDDDPVAWGVFGLDTTHVGGSDPKTSTRWWR